MATITKRNKSYQFRVYAGYDITGKQIVKSKTWTPPADWSEKRAEKEAVVQAALFEDQVRNGLAGNGKIRFSDFAELWFTQYAEKQLRPRTVARYRELLVRIDLALGHLPLEKIRPVNLLEFYGSLANVEPSNATYCCRMDLRKILKERSITQAKFSKLTDVSLTTLSSAWHQQPISRKSAEKICAGLDVPLGDYFSPTDPGLCLSPTTVRHYHSLISDILSDAVRWQYIPFSPCDRIDPPKVASPEILYLDDTQTRQLVTELRKAPGFYRRAIQLLLLTGMRRGELLGLEWKDVNWEDQSLRIMRTSQYLPERGVYTDETKNASSCRLIEVSQQVITILQKQQQWQQIQKKISGDTWIESDRIITGEDGSPMRPDRLSSWFRKFIRQTELPPIKIHSLRHTYATLCIANGVPLTAVAEQLGHATVATTANIYAHAIKSAKIAGANKVSSIVADIL